MNRYITFHILTDTVSNQNTVGENQGNTSCLQTATLGDSLHSVMPAVALSYAIRKSIQEHLEEGDRLWRQVKAGHEFKDAEHASRFVYVSDKGSEVLKMQEAVPTNPERYLDILLRGCMVKPQGSGKKNIARKGAVNIGDAYSLSEYTGESFFHQGHKADGKLNPFTKTLHNSQYQYYVTVDLGMLTSPEGRKAFKYLLQALGAGLAVGGGQSNSPLSVKPHVLVVREHRSPAHGMPFPGPYGSILEGDLSKESCIGALESYGKSDFYGQSEARLYYGREKCAKALEAMAKNFLSNHYPPLAPDPECLT